MKSGIKRLARIAGLTIVVVFTGLVVYAWLHYSPAGAVYPASEVSHLELLYRLRNWDEHDAARTRNGGNPYILHVETDQTGELLYYGASHSSDPKHPQIADITARWEAFEPTGAEG